MNDDRRLIEDYLPIEAISKEASRERSVRKGHISTLHLWWTRRPLVACRAAVYGALVPASRFQVGQASSLSSTGQRPVPHSLTRANAAKFVERLCQYPGSPQAIAEAQKHILEAHAERLSKEIGKPVTVQDIVEGRARRPKVLDMFAGGGAIPLVALRLGVEAGERKGRVNQIGCEAFAGGAVFGRHALAFVGGKAGMVKAVEDLNGGLADAAGGEQVFDDMVAE